MSFATNIRTQGQNWVHPSRALRRAGVVLAAAGLGLAIAFAATSGGDATRIAVTTVEPQQTFATPVQLAAATQPGVLIQPVAVAPLPTIIDPVQLAAATQPGVLIQAASAAPGSQPAYDFAIGAQPGVLFPLEASPAPVASVSIDAFNQNPHQNPALTTAPVATSSARSVDTLNQNPRQNPLAAPTTSTVAQSEEPEVFNQNPRHA